VRAWFIGLLLWLGPRLVNAQAADTTTRTLAPPIGVWATVTLGPGTASNRDVTLIAGQMGGYVSIGSWYAGYRRGGASGIDTGGAYDDAVLVGRGVTNLLATGFAAVGLSQVFDVNTGRRSFGVGFSAEAGGNLRVIGIGASVFGAFTQRLSYVGLGLTLDAGWIR
jgi:hypothetical protein